MCFIVILSVANKFCHKAESFKIKVKRLLQYDVFFAKCACVLLYTYLHITNIKIFYRNIDDYVMYIYK